MKINLGHLASAVVVLLCLFSYQNCGQAGRVAVEQPSDNGTSGTPGTASQPQYAQMDFSKTAAPPLKLFFIMDNSNSMTLNNLNLKKSISAMFDQQAENISAFDSEIYFISTAQSPTLASNFLTKLKAPEQLSNLTLAQINSQYRGNTWINGEIAGDLLGFKLSQTNSPELIKKVYLPQPVVKLEDSSQGLRAIASVSYKKGSSVAVLKDAVAERLDILSPEKASQITDSNLFTALDTESPLCAIARVLRNPQGLANPGDVASFIIVSDENESDPTGSKCLAESRRNFLYSISCMHTVPASTLKQTKFSYSTVSGQTYQQTVLTVTPPDTVNKKKITTIKLSRAAANSSCVGTFEKDFNAVFTYKTPQFKISYTQWAKIGEREGGVIIYADTPTSGNLMLDGQLPGDCSSNVGRLKTALNNTTAKLRIDSCLQDQEKAHSPIAKILSYASYPTVQLSTSTACSDSLKTSLMSGYTGTLASCVLSKRLDSIPAAWITAHGFSAAGSQDDCIMGVTKVCSTSSGNYRSCAQTAYTAAKTAVTRGPISHTENAAVNCSSACSLFPGLCSANDSTSVSSYAIANQLACTATVADSADTYTVAQSAKDVTLNTSSAITCSSTCLQAPGACSNTTGSQTISVYNKSCSVKTASHLVPGSGAVVKDLATVTDSNHSLSCQSLCSAAVGACAGLSSAAAATTTVAQFITSAKSGQSCNTAQLSQNIPASTNRQTVTKLKPQNANASSCPANYELESKMLTGDFIDENETTSGSLNLPDYINNKLAEVIGVKGSTLSAFITPNGGGSAALATSYGQQFELLVNRIGRGTVNNIKAPSYDQALLNLSGILRAQLIRSMIFPQVHSGQAIHKVWKKPKSQNDWQEPLAANLWSASGGTVTLDESVDIDYNDEVKVEFY